MRAELQVVGPTNRTRWKSSRPYYLSCPRSMRRPENGSFRLSPRSTESVCEEVRYLVGSNPARCPLPRPLELHFRKTVLFRQKNLCLKSNRGRTSKRWPAWLITSPTTEIRRTSRHWT